MRNYLLLLGILLTTFPTFSQTYTISGYIEDADSGEKLIAANVFDGRSLSGTVSNTYGFYSLTLPVDTVALAYSYIGYQAATHDFYLDRDTVINIRLQQSIEIEEIEITASSSYRVEEESQMSAIEIPIAQIKKVPALLGEVDVLKALQLLPGIQSGGEGQSGLYVRGGSPDQNLILLDGVPVYNVSHLFGFFSVFNADAIQDVRLIKGGFPARYGGRLSSVIDISMKEGNNQGIHGSGSIGLVASKFTIEGPIRSEKTSFIFSGRRTYADLIARPFIKKSFESDNPDIDNSGNTGYYFYDINAKINHRFTESDRLYLSFYGGNDDYFFWEQSKRQFETNREEFDLTWGNITAALRWNHVFNQKLFANSTLTYSRFKFDVGSLFSTELNQPSIKEEISLQYVSGIDDVAGKIDFDYVPNPDHFIRFGVGVIQHRFKPGTFELDQEDPFDEITLDTTIGQRVLQAQEFALYAEDDFRVSPSLKVNAGLHFSAFNVEGKLYSSLQPRLSMRYFLPKGIALKASYASMRQYVHLLAFEGIGLPTDLWVPSTKRVRPQDSWQVALGLAKTLGSDYEVSVEGYYKKMRNVISYKEGSGLFEFSDWQDRVTQGDGESYGAELFIQKKRGRLTGWLGYTLSWSLRQFDELNFGKEFPFRYDRRHDISVVASYQLSEKVDIAGTWVYGTGNAVTLANSRHRSFVRVSDTFNAINSSFFANRNNFRMAAYHRFDIGINFTKKKKKYDRTFSIGAYNAYNRKNPFFIFEDRDVTIQPDGTIESEVKLKQQSLFPIIPYFTYSFKF